MSDSTKHTAGLTNEGKRDAVVTAALDWFSERAIKDWSEAYLAHAIISMEGDWPGCEGCDFECDEPCTPATESEQHHAIDCCIAQRVHDGKLVKPMDYEPPEGWKPIVMRPKRNIEAKISRLLDATQAERDTLRAEVERLRADAIKSERRAIEYSDIIQHHVIVMRAAVVASSLYDSGEGMLWIKNTLLGPGHYPNIESARELGGAQALFDKEMAEHEAFRAAHPLPAIPAALKGGA